MEISTETLIFLILRSSDLDDRSSAPSPEFTSEQLRSSSEQTRTGLLYFSYKSGL
jgi:hypothetical protein